MAKSCRDCSAPMVVDQRFCSDCGCPYSTPTAQRFCYSCGLLLSTPTQRFCGHCGGQNDATSPSPMYGYQLDRQHLAADTYLSSAPAAPLSYVSSPPSSLGSSMMSNSTKLRSQAAELASGLRMEHSKLKIDLARRSIPPNNTRPLFGRLGSHRDTCYIPVVPEATTTVSHQLLDRAPQVLVSPN